MRARLTTAPRQGLRLAPGVQLALKFLQIPALELQAWVNQEILSNPLLELEEDDGSRDDSNETSPGEGSEPAETGEPEPDLEEWRSYEAFETDVALPRGLREEPERSGQDWQAAVPTLQEALRDQLRLQHRDPSLLAVGEFLIGCLDDRGYLTGTMEEVADHLQVDLDLVERARTALQGLDPPGIGARDLQECLRLQLRAAGREGSLAWALVTEQFANLSKRRHTEMARRLHVAVPEIEVAIQEIRRLRPHPGRLVAPQEVRYIYPDLVVSRIGDRFEVLPSDRCVPRLRVSRAYRDLIQGAEGPEGPEATEYLKDRLRSARWMVQALDRRRETMLRVMRAIVEEQIEFFEHGLARLRPLTLLAVARQVGLHESTVARVTKSKYVQTPRGIFPLKFFFSSRIQTQLGLDTSSRAVRERIRNLVLEEDPRWPLSDEAIAGILEREGIRIARRTVAKYRDQMRIERAPRRRRDRNGGSGDSSPEAEKRVA